MPLLHNLISGIRALLQKQQRSHDLDEELLAFQQASAQEKIRSGLSPQEAQRAARAEMGSVETVKQKVCSATWESTAESIAYDIRYGVRQLLLSPGFTIVAFLTLALGIGANAAIFTLVNTVLLQNLPVVDPATLIRVGDDDQCCVNGGVIDDGHHTLFATDTYNYLRKNIPEFEELAAMQAGYEFNSVTIRRDGVANVAQSVKGEYVSGNYFRTFGLKPAAGRLITNTDDVKGAPMTAVMSYNTWKNTYNGDPSVVGSTFWINTRPVTVIGIAPKGFFGDRLASHPPDYYLPIATAVPLANAEFAEDPTARWVYIVGRVRPGTATAPLEQKINIALRQTFAANDKDYKGPEGEKRLPKVHTNLSPGGAGIQMMQESYASHLKLLTWIAGLVLLITCANIANLLLVRGMGRRTEISVRTALGAQRSRIIRQLLTESVLLSVLGGIAGLAVAYAGAHMLLALAFPGATNVPIDPAPSATSLALPSFSRSSPAFSSELHLPGSPRRPNPPMRCAAPRAPPPPEPRCCSASSS